VGIGPGAADHLSARALAVLEAADVVVGYTTYVDLVRPLIRTRRVVATPMMKEVERVEAALEAAGAGHRCALISSGDPGIYAMAGLVFEICARRQVAVVGPDGDPGQGLRVEVVPGIPALCAGAALLGAPLTHDFAVISLSDLLTPWTTIETRLEAAARADFVIVLYNPRSRRRTDHLPAAQRIVLRHRDGATPTGVVTGASRDHQRVTLVSLDRLHEAPVDMQTIVFIGSRASLQYRDFMVTPRGYARKYAI
jgi:precorrin-3B C17-methyltransferase